ncbi:maleylpyruvate isomerase family mycothiol-dependent enzyme [Lentzea sp.]|uniref:maleylpyruvate isomerase family mycothiol-dependent enzyme n=1 Tax=Lentzea sp. TaxID=56099 RepID=UPI002ECFFC0C
MDDQRIWQTIDAERAAAADLVGGLTEAQWACPSLCAGWTVREVAAHLTLGPRMTVGATLGAFARARGSFNRMVDRTARAEALRPTGEIVSQLRGIVGSRRLAPGQSLKNALMDAMVHLDDMALPLGVDHSMPIDAAVVAADDLWRMGFPFHARRRFAGHRLVATDADWSAGEGAEISGPIGALVMALAGRTATIPRLTGITA